jgi:hypothetical protein
MTTTTDKPLTDRDKVLEILRKNLIKFGKLVKPITFYLPSPEIHLEIAKLFLTESIKKLLIIAPRGIAKSTLVTIYILHHLWFGDKGRKLIVVISKTQTHARAILSTVKDIVEFSDGFRKLFGYHGSVVAKSWREDRVIFDNGDSIIARGTRQPIRGINEKTQRPTLIIIDDPEDENNTKTIDAMDDNVNWVLTAVVPALDAHRGRIIVIGTPLHERCIVSVLEGMGSWTTVRCGNNIEEGIALWPESKSLEQLRKDMEDFKSAGKVRIYYQEYECNLIPGGDALFKKEYIECYDEDTVIEFKQDEPYLKFSNDILLPVNIYMGVDPASTVSQSADFSTIVPVAVTSDLRIFVLDYFRKRVAPLDHADAIESYFLRLHPRLTLIESTGYQNMLRQYLRSRIFIPGLESKETPTDAKDKRYIEMLQPAFAQHRVFLKGKIENGKYSGPMQELYDELLLFPKSKHDDLLDGLYYACKRVRPPSHSVVEVKPPLPEYQQVLVDYYQRKDEENEIPIYYEDVFS